MKKIVCLLLLITIFVLGCGNASNSNNTSNTNNASNPNNIDSNSNGMQEVRIGTYQMNSGDHSVLYLYNDGIAGYMFSSGQSGLPMYNYAVKNEKVILTEERNNDEFMVFELTEDGNLKTGENVYYYIGKDEIGNGNYNDPGEPMDGGEPTSKTVELEPQ